ncbi:ABC transporter ATP-binding protein [Aminivibrio sp.]|jgi:molybdate transport system ATP-binding protein|uniref:ABC transporter ATP-binding protein n=1 Tax=Aminivibrio sp. TaxID=1872489 RepID=UPI001A5960DB|nr:ABC transporter ATP-binding protein [Aminivibrio sp.]
MLRAEFRDAAGSFFLNISMEVGAETAVLFGRSGSGKSLTLRSLAGLRTPVEGRIILGERVLFSSSERINLPPRDRKVGLLFQDLALFPHMTALENVAYALPKGRKGRMKAEEWLARVKMSGFEDRLPERLSGGQRQRVALARALAAEPDLLLLDEPFSALDGPLRRSLRKELRDIRLEAGIPMVYVTHQIEDLCSLGDRVTIMKDGATTESFPVGRLWERGARGEAWNALGWGNLFRGSIVCREGGFRFEGETVSLDLDGGGLFTGEGLVFVAPDRIRILYPDLPVDQDLGNNLFTAVVEEILPLGSSVRLYLAAEDGTVWQTEHSSGSYEALRLHPGSPVRFAVPPSAPEVWMGPGMGVPEFNRNRAENLPLRS